MTPIEQAIEALPKYTRHLDGCLVARTVLTSLPPQDGPDTPGTCTCGLERALSALQSMEEGEAGMSTDEAMTVIDQATDEDLKNNDPDLWVDLRKEFDFFLSTKKASPSVPRLTVDQVMEVLTEWNATAPVHKFGDDESKYEERKLSDLKQRLTQSAKTEVHGK